jgi:hypothetical protein
MKHTKEYLNFVLVYAISFLLIGFVVWLDLKDIFSISAIAIPALLVFPLYFLAVHLYLRSRKKEEL